MDVIATGFPPSAETRNKPFEEPKRMVPSLFQVQPEKSGASKMAGGGPREASTFFSFPLITNAIERLSADQNGWAASSVPGIFCGATEPIGRTYKNHVSWRLARATMATVRPSG